MSSGFGAWLSAQMARCGFSSNVELEQETGIGNTTISRWRNGTMAPSVDQLRKLEKPLRTPLLELLVRAGVLSADEAKVPREALARITEPPPANVAWAVEHDPDLIEEARAHLLNQYDLLRRLSDPAASKERTRPTTPAAPERPLRAVARKRPPRNSG